MAVSRPTSVTSTWRIDPTETTVVFVIEHAMFPDVTGRLPGVAGVLRLASDDYQTAHVELTI